MRGNPPVRTIVSKQIHGRGAIPSIGGVGCTSNLWPSRPALQTLPLPSDPSSSGTGSVSQFKSPNASRVSEGSQLITMIPASDFRTVSAAEIHLPEGAPIGGRVAGHTWPTFRLARSCPVVPRTLELASALLQVVSGQPCVAPLREGRRHECMRRSRKGKHRDRCRFWIDDVATSPPRTALPHWRFATKMKSTYPALLHT